MVNKAKKLSIGKQLIENLKGENIKDYLRLITSDPHIAGTQNNKKVGEKILNLWKKNGLENVHFVEYEVLLSYPDFDNPNHISIVNRDGKILYKSNGTSPVIFPKEQGAPNAGIQWVAYSAPGENEGEIVYCHYGRKEDFEKLKKLGIKVAGNIAMIRYSHGFRGDKVGFAQKFGAIGVILFSDPAEVAQEGTDKAHVYPNAEWMPKGGVQRGSVLHQFGDPLTPLTPAKPDLYKSRTIEEAKAAGILPKIPVLPLSYKDAYEILVRLSGNLVPFEWQGGLNFTYHLGPGFHESGTKVKLSVKAKYEKREIRNIVGYIYGKEEPDKYVILGNHYDAWVYGSIDPNSGTSTLAEVARAMTQTMNETGWRPSRTIMFCNWDAEEYGLIGSTEFVEEFEKQLNERAVVYLNVDLISANNSFDAATIPSLYHVVVDVAKRIPNPLESEIIKGRKTIYDTWIKTFPSNFPSHPEFPQMNIPAGGSDHTAFLNFVGIPVVDFRYHNASWSHGYEYPLYHSLYETKFLNEHIFDTNNLAVHRAVGQFWAELARVFADSPIIPVNITFYAETLLNVYVKDLIKDFEPLENGYSEAKDAKKQLSNLIKNCEEFLKQSHQLENEIQKIQKPNSKDNFRSRILSNRILSVERCFINVYIRPENPSKRHLLYSVSDKDLYSSNVMSGVYDAIDNFINSKTDKNKLAAGKELAKQISYIQAAVQCAINTIKEYI
uniref:Glutamate carboxypeptidase II n=1 Tax=Panagrolaimus davidi TaxID=227884 RepID=A0A914QB99_9BILA